MKKIESASNPYVKHLSHLKHNRDFRIEHRRVLLEGKTIIEEWAHQLKIKTLIIENEAALPSNIKADEVVVASSSIIKKITGMEMAEMILAEVEMPEHRDFEANSSLLVLDGISDPGNMGTLLRTALAFDFKNVLLLNHCCDPYNDKALRASRGSCFGLNWKEGSLKDLKSFLNKNKLPVYIADIKGEEPSKLPSNCILVLGSEGSGTSNEVKELGSLITLPMSSKVESLNVSVAGGILMYLLRPSK